MRHLVGVILATTVLLGACALDEEAPELGTTAQEISGDFMQGDFMQGTGDFMQGPVDAVWGFSTTGWKSGDFRLKNTGVVNGHLVALWDKTAPCTGPLNNSPSRSCDWHTPGHAFCTAGTTVTVRAGGCAANPQQRSMIRVCAGKKSCTHAAAIASVDAACSGTTNPAVTFTCPSTGPGPGPLGGRYFVMVGPKNAGFGTPAASFTFTTQTTPFTTFTTTLSGADFEGTILDGKRDLAPQTVRYRISAPPEVDIKDETGSTSLYALREDNAGAAPLCAGPENKALPTEGRWDPNGTFSGSTMTFTFACTIGVIAKCYRHGYRPWSSHNGTSLRDFHQTCTRAARGDFCADGGSFTVNGTTIDLYDRIDFSVTSSNPAMEIEAVWRREAIGETSSPAEPRCLSKKRWDTMPYDGAGRCTDLEDPRTNGDDVDYTYCDGFSADAWFAENDAHLIITESALYDAGLWRWRKGGDFRSTSTTVCTTMDDSSPCVSDGYEYAPGSQPVLLGSVFHKDLHPDLRPQNTIPLYTLRNATGSYLTTTAESFSGYGEPTLEGYIYNTSCDATGCGERVPLELWAGNGKYVTLVDGQDPGPGYFHWQTLGYLPR